MSAHHALLLASYGHFRPASGIAAAPIEGMAWTAVRTASMAASAYHGARRNDSVFWGLCWGLFGYSAPVLTPVIAVAQGFGKVKR